MGFTYILFHTFQTQNNLVTQIAQNLSGSETRAFCLLQILEYFASECEDENIVIEESLRELLFDFMDQIVEQVFVEILTPFCNQNTSVDLKIGVIKAFYQWMRLKLPDQIIMNLPDSNILEFIFNEIKDANDDLIENCTDCII
jgi:hypothetical protein